jgi:hypothetical protein
MPSRIAQRYLDILLGLQHRLAQPLARQRLPLRPRNSFLFALIGHGAPSALV